MANRSFLVVPLVMAFIESMAWEVSDTKIFVKPEEVSALRGARRLAAYLYGKQV